MKKFNFFKRGKGLPTWLVIRLNKIIFWYSTIGAQWYEKQLLKSWFRKKLQGY
jgi:hypothetical protein